MRNERVDLLKELKRINPLSNIIMRRLSSMSHVVECLAAGQDYLSNFSRTHSLLSACGRPAGGAWRRHALDG